jgi:hypothetical protein
MKIETEEEIAFSMLLHAVAELRQVLQPFAAACQGHEYQPGTHLVPLPLNALRAAARALTAPSPYPSQHGPDVDWAHKQAWEILDIFPPEIILPHVRNFLAGMLVAAFCKVNEARNEKNKRTKPGPCDNQQPDPV